MNHETSLNYFDLAVANIGDTVLASSCLLQGVELYFLAMNCAETGVLLVMLVLMMRRPYVHFFAMVDVD